MTARLIDFQHADEAPRWRAINDEVMGGISRGGLHQEDGSGVFSGETSLENNGGFASVRREPEAMDLSDASGLVLYVRGDGRRYQLRLRNDQLPEGAAYRALFQPAAEEWQHVALPWQEFEAVFRGRRLADAPPLDPAAIQQVGFLIADRRPGPFRLEVAWLGTMDSLPFRQTRLGSPPRPASSLISPILMLRMTFPSTGGMTVIIKALALSLILVGSVGLASADYTEGMRYYERQEYRQALQEFGEAARSGDADAQYMLGRLHEAGNGTTQDFVQAHKWYNLAAARGHRHAAEARDSLAGRMTTGQVAEAQQATRGWEPEESPSSQATPQSRPDIETLSDRQGVAEIQRELNRLGYDAGPVDGAMGSRTRNAIREYQADQDMAQDGRATADLLRRLREAQKEEVATPSEPQPETSSRVALNDDFNDGNYRRDPPWTVLSGNFEVDENGLRSIVETQRTTARETRRLSAERPEEIGLAMLELILEQTGNTRQGEDVSIPVEPARIFVNAPVDNAFRMELELASRERTGSLELGLFQGNRPNGTGYRLVYTPGSRPGLSLVRLISGNAEVVARHEGTLDLEDGRFHRMVWTRDENGRMQVRVDDQRLIRVQDNGLRDPFQGFMLANQGGDYTLRRIRLEE
ncbi:CIA30 family protein [Halomonas sp. ATCH28]|uniref:CIA30 family protein n=1 Tax=Halomonas gemina TaxID=2945105 RepID=A0ABT0T5K5_9GAMM|nr:CIA30 family protein [Halomonas gemina]MCL7942184.1 CIA30 family protein [Halomonas gemina]